MEDYGRISQKRRGGREAWLAAVLAVFVHAALVGVGVALAAVEMEAFTPPRVDAVAIAGAKTSTGDPEAVAGTPPAAPIAADPPAPPSHPIPAPPPPPQEVARVPEPPAPVPEEPKKPATPTPRLPDVRVVTRKAADSVAAFAERSVPSVNRAADWLAERIARLPAVDVTPPAPLREPHPEPPKVVAAAPKPAEKPVEKPRAPRPLVATPSGDQPVTPKAASSNAAAATPNNNGTAGTGTVPGLRPGPPTPGRGVGEGNGLAKVGDGQGIAQPSLYYNPKPVYPADALAARLEGRVLLKVKLSDDGSVLEASVYESSQVASLDDSALATVRYWRFSPAKKYGVPIEYEVLVPVRFVIYAR